MAKDLKETISNLNKGTAKFDENMEALKHSFLTKKYFKEQEKEKEKKKEKK
jgi:phospholipid/cholesterol/gamma-HCH transport system substrate-binding protein